jgi:hypothetical protein
MSRQQELCKNFQHGRYRSSLPLFVVAASDLIPDVHFYSSSVATLAMGARTSNLVTSVDSIHVSDVVRCNTERSAGPARVLSAAAAGEA